MKIKTIDIDAKEWFDKSAGNSYFAAIVTLNKGYKSEQSFTIPFQYGYGDQYKHKAFDELRKRKLIVCDERTIYWRYYEDHKIIVRSHKADKCLKRELMAIGAN